MFRVLAWFRDGSVCCGHYCEMKFGKGRREGRPPAEGPVEGEGMRTEGCLRRKGVMGDMITKFKPILIFSKIKFIY